MDTELDLSSLFVLLSIYSNHLTNTSFCSAQPISVLLSEISNFISHCSALISRDVTSDCTVWLSMLSCKRFLVQAWEESQTGRLLPPNGRVGSVRASSINMDQL